MGFFSQNYNKGMWFLFNIFLKIRWNKILQKVPATRIMVLPHKEIVCTSFRATGRNFLSFENKFCHRKKISFTGRNVLAQDESCRHRKKFALIAKKILLQENSFYHRKQFTVTVTNFLSKEKNSCHRKKFFSRNIFPVRQS